VRTRLAILVTALWIGGLATICGLVAPTLFSVFDRHQAGIAAGAMFRAIAWVGVVAAPLVLALRIRNAIRPEVVLLSVAGIAPIAAELVLQPMMNAAQLAGNTSRFLTLHAAAGLLFVGAAVCGAILLWLLTRRAE
jgi:Domain of unknown function (DUF4149)